MALSERCMDVGVLWPNQMVRWIKMKPGTQVGLSPGHIVLDEDWGPSSPPLKELSPTPQFLAHICCGHWMNQDATWCAGRPRPRRLCVRSEPSSPSTKGESVKKD